MKGNVLEGWRPGAIAARRRRPFSFRQQEGMRGRKRTVIRVAEDAG